MRKAPASRTQTRSLESCRAVLDAVARLITARRVASVTTAAVAAEAGVTWGVLQYHFGSKEALFAAVLDSNQRPSA